MKPETVFRRRILPKLKALPNCVVFPVQQKSISGDPDYILCLNGYFVALELKSELGEASELQKYKLNEVGKSGGVAILCYPDNWEIVYDFLKRIATLPVPIRFTAPVGLSRLGQ